jgi:predicted Holliday junction resolvase-like endonuclease
MISYIIYIIINLIISLYILIKNDEIAYLQKLIKIKDREINTLRMIINNKNRKIYHRLSCLFAKFPLEPRIHYESEWVFLLNFFDENCVPLWHL